MWTSVSGSFDRWSKKDSYYISLSDVGTECVEAIIEFYQNKLKEAVKKCDYDAVANIAGDIKVLTTAFQDAKNQADEEYHAYLEEEREERKEAYRERKANGLGQEGDADAE